MTAPEATVTRHAGPAPSREAEMRMLMESQDFQTYTLANSWVPTTVSGGNISATVYNAAAITNRTESSSR